MSSTAAASSATSTADPHRPPRSAFRRILITLATLAVVGVFFGGASAASPTGMAPQYDEAVYFSQFAPGQPLIWAPTRALGVPLLVAPVSATGGDFESARSIMAGVHAALLAAVILVWYRRIGWGALAAGAFFAVGWIPLAYGRMVFPNLLSALLVALVVGLWLDRRMIAIVSLPPLALVAGLVRPLDAGVGLVVCTAVWMLDSQRRGDRLRALSLANGYIFLVAPFALEASLRFGGVLARIRASEVWVPSGWRWNGSSYASMLDGPSRLPDPTPGLTLDGSAWIGMMLVAIVLGTTLSIARGLGRSRLRFAAVAFGGGLALAAPYLVWFGEGSSVASRFLLPAMLLVCLSAGAALASGLDRTRLPIGPVVALLLVSVAHPVEARFASAERDARDQRDVDVTALAQRINERTGGEPCALLTGLAGAQLRILTGCEVRQIPDTEDWLLTQYLAGKRSIVVSGRLEKPPSAVASWHFVRLVARRGLIYVYTDPTIPVTELRGRRIPINGSS